MRLTARIVRRPDGTFQAWCPSLPGCRVAGQTQEEAWSRIQTAVNGYVASLGAALPVRIDQHLKDFPLAEAA